MSPLLATAAALGLGFAAALAFAPRDGFETEIFIAAPPETVWSLLTDPQEHANWNPGMRSVEGRFVAGERLRLSMRTPSGGTMTFRPIVLVTDPARELRWLGRLGMPRLFDGEHYFRLTAENGGTRLVHGEKFHGLLLWVMDVHQFKASFEAANEGLKARAEALISGYSHRESASPGAIAPITATLNEGPWL